MKLPIKDESTPLVAVNSHYLRDEKQESIYDRYGLGNMYIGAIIEAGAIPIIVPKIEKEQLLDFYAEKADAFVFIGGPDYPSEFYGDTPAPENMSHKHERPHADLYLMRKALESKRPLLGICAGEQLLSIVSGGKLIQHIRNADDHTGEKYHRAKICGGRILKSLVETNDFEINSSHHQAVNPDLAGKGLVVSALAEDGTVEAIEGNGEEFRLGLQFHIERHKDEKFRRRVFDLLIKKAREYKNEQED